MISRSSRIYGMSLGLFALLLFSSAALAKGVPTEVEITGPGIATPIRETNPLALPTLGIVGFMDSTRIITPPAGNALAYEMTRDGGERVRFYPSPGGSCGAVFSIGDPGQIGTEFDNHWYRATCSGDLVFRTALAMRGIAVPGDYPNLVHLAQEATAPVNATDRADAPWPRWLLPLTGIVGLAVGLCVARVIPKRALSRDTRAHRTAPG
ncbi:MAG: hypothetical protein ACR2M3_13290 [Thermomicrobiales bacterium]